MSAQLLDETRRPVPACNVTGDSGSQFYVSDPSHYEENRKSLQNSRMYTIITAALLVLFLCIFSLNFSVAGWSAGNILTFGIVVAILYATTQSAKQWNAQSSLLQELTRQGVPCLKIEKDANIIHCRH